MTKISYYCDRCRKEIECRDRKSMNIKIFAERVFEPHSNRAEKYIDENNNEWSLLCSACSHYLIDFLLIHEG